MTKLSEETLKRYKSHLRKAFDLIGRDPKINEAKCWSITKSAESVSSKLGVSESNTQWGFKLNPLWHIPILSDEGYFEEKDTTLIIGAQMQVIDSSFTMETVCYFSIVKNHWGKSYDSCCENACKDQGRVVRRFHFDTCQGVSNKLETNTHVHFGGRLDERDHYFNHEGKKLHYCFDSKLGPPRLPYPPLDIVLLFDLLLKQFTTVIDRKFVNTTEWRSIVRNSEDLILKDYYLKISKYYAEKATGLKNRYLLFEELCK